MGPAPAYKVGHLGAGDIARQEDPVSGRAGRGIIAGRQMPARRVFGCFCAGRTPIPAKSLALPKGSLSDILGHPFWYSLDIQEQENVLKRRIDRHAD